MNSQVRPLLVAMAGAALLGTGALLWLARDAFGTPGRANGRLSLLEILEDLQQDSQRNRQPRALPPPPPAQPAWRMPVAESCPVVDPAVGQRLARLLAMLPATTRRIRIDPSNYGPRFTRDIFGNPVDPTPQVVVLHETVYGLSSAINTFRTPHPRDEDQVSYHVLIGGDGSVVQTVDPSQRAFGAGNSAFNGRWVLTNPRAQGSINNFALHLSLETPIDGEDEEPGHSGYTDAQYDALAVVLSDWMRRYRIPPRNITTHRHVDLAGARADPRSFDWYRLALRLRALGALC